VTRLETACHLQPPPRIFFGDGRERGRRELSNDEQLARDLLSGNEEAFTRFVNAYRARLSQYSFLICGHREDAEEVAQETLLRVFESADQLRDPARLRAWVFRIAKNECFMKRRKSVFAPKTELSLDELRPRKPDGDPAAPEIADWSRLPDDLLFDSELHRALLSAIQQLPEVYKTALLLRDVEELTTDETAEALEISINAVKTRVHRGRLALRRHMESYLRSVQEKAEHD